MLARVQADGRVVEPGDAEGLSAALIQSLGRSAEASAEDSGAEAEARRRVAEGYSVERLCRSIQDLYLALLNGVAPERVREVNG